jgi:1-aminocyclopropane-1-carboxylate deaminase/D-cysteine desulfhydrase-like pyridoxal-dependent ACC family enzyme
LTGKKSETPTGFADEITSSPLQKLQSTFLENAGIALYIKRDDLLHPLFGGNKWRKLKYNLIHAREANFNTLLTFGGAWSNHIYATAAAGSHFGFKTIGLIRGEKHTPLNATLSFAKECGMQLHYIDRMEYRHKNEAEYIERLKQQFGNVYILPEGGSNSLALKGCAEIVEEIDIPFDVICCASGTGATLAGMASAITAAHTTTEQSVTAQEKMAIGFSALKGGEFLAAEVTAFLNSINNKDKEPASNWCIESRYHFGGYAKINEELVQFMHEFQSRYGIPLDAVYTSKMFYGLFELIKSGSFKPGTKIIAVHSGGLQGNKGFNL